MKNERIIVLRSPAELERAQAVLASLPLDNEFPWEVAVRKHNEKRTLEQNKRYHAVCKEISEQLILMGKTYHPDTLKEYFKRLFIGSVEVQMPDGTTMQHGISTTTLNVGQFANYMTRIDLWGAEHGVIFEETRAMLNQYAEEARRWREREEKKGGVE